METMVFQFVSSCDGYGGNFHDHGIMTIQMGMLTMTVATLIEIVIMLKTVKTVMESYARCTIQPVDARALLVVRSDKSSEHLLVYEG